MAIGFDVRSVDALLVHGYALEGLTVGQCGAIAEAVSRLGSGLVAVPHGDLSEKRSPGDAVPFSFVVGALVARAGTAAQEDATTQSAVVSEALCEKVEASFEAARPLLDPALASVRSPLLGTAGAPLPRPGLFLVAAGPHASARLSGEGNAALHRVRGAEDTEELLQDLTVGNQLEPEAPKLKLKGTFVLSARYR